MNSFEINKLIGSIIFVILVIIGINKLANVIYKVKAPEGNIYKVATETKEISKDDNAKAEVVGNIKALLALGSIDHGKTVFNKCAACHSVAKGGGNKIGPSLWGVIGRKAGSIGDYKYSKAMSEFDKTWDFKAINIFLIKPKDYVKGTKMAYAGLKKEKDRASIILYLNEQVDSPLPLS